MYRDILCAVDFSEPSRAALHRAIALATTFDASLTIVHVVQPPSLPIDVPVNPGWMQEVHDQVEGTLLSWKQVAATAGVKRIETVLLEGNTWDLIVTRARDGGSDLIVAGTHGRIGIKHVLLGSVAERVVRHASCDVLIVRAPSSGE